MNTGAMNEKPWGHWRLLYVDDVYELRKLTLKAGGWCSRHFHTTKCNVFHVLSGSVRVKEYYADTPGEEGMFAVHILTEGSEPVHIPAGVQHRFEVLEDAVVYEYSLAREGEKMDVNEIHRLDESGFREPQPQENEDD